MEDRGRGAQDSGSADRRRFWVAAIIGFGVTILILAIVAATVLVSRDSGSGTNAGESGQSSPVSAQVVSPISVSLQLSKPSVEVLSDMAATASLSPSGDTGLWTLQVLGESTWTDVAKARPDLQGLLAYAFQAPDAAGAYLYRVVLFNPRGAVTASSDAVELSVARLSTQQVVVSWPKRPADYCASVGLPVEVSPAVARPVILQSSADGRTWVDAGAAITNAAGQGRLDTPPCNDGADADLGSLKWRVVAPETPTYGQDQSKTGTIRWCPAPGSVPFQTRTADEYSPPTVDVTNPSIACAAMVTLAAELYCYQLDVDAETAVEAPTDPLIIGYRQSTPPMYVGTGVTRNFILAEVFTDSQRRCQAYYPSFEIYAIPNTVKVWADSFTAP